MKVRHKGAEEYVWAMGIDPSLTGFGVALWRPGDECILRYSSKLKHVDRLIDICDWLVAQIDMYQSPYSRIGHVCVEGLAYGAKYSTGVLGELSGVLKKTLREMLGDPVGYPTIVPPQTLKKFVTGKGNTPKDAMKLYVYKKWGREFKTTDEADAYGLARIAAAILNTDQPRHQYETDVLTGLTRWTEQPQRNQETTKGRSRQSRTSSG